MKDGPPSLRCARLGGCRALEDAIEDTDRKQAEQPEVRSGKQASVFLLLLSGPPVEHHHVKDRSTTSGLMLGTSEYHALDNKDPAVILHPPGQLRKIVNRAVVVPVVQHIRQEVAVAARWKRDEKVAALDGSCRDAADQSIRRAGDDLGKIKQNS